MSFFRRHPNIDDPDTDEEQDENIDPELRLRTVRTAASTMSEAAKSEARAHKRRSLRRKGSKFFRKGGAKRPKTADSVVPELPRPVVEGERRNVYVNHRPPWLT